MTGSANIFEFFYNLLFSAKSWQNSASTDGKKQNKNCPQSLLNPQPPDLHSNALPTQLSQHSVASLNLHGLCKVVLYNKNSCLAQKIANDRKTRLSLVSCLAHRFHVCGVTGTKAEVSRDFHSSSFNNLSKLQRRDYFIKNCHSSSKHLSHSKVFSEIQTAHCKETARKGRGSLQHYLHPLNLRGRGPYQFPNLLNTCITMSQGPPWF